jgi:4-amino-4-deoxy-L-arabinose transferase-like glycosyltransferase
LFFSRLRSPLLEPEEARYAEIPRQMLAEGRFIVPILHGQSYCQKPPLLYWLVMAAYTAFGVHDWAARLVPCTAALLVVFIMYSWGRRAVGPRSAFLGSLILCLSARFAYLGRMLTMDSLLCLWIVAAWAAAYLALTSPIFRRGWWLASALACGFGLLTKGPVALVLVAVPVLLYGLLDTRSARPRIGRWLGYLTVSIGLAGPWYAAVARAEPALAGDFFWRHNLLRFVAAFDHQEPFWYYLPQVLTGMLPWSLLLLPLMKWLGRRTPAVQGRPPPALGFCLLACGWCLLFYSVAGCKRPGYMLPALPPLAMALGCCLDGMLPHRPFRSSATIKPASRVLGHQATLAVLGIGIVSMILATHADLQKPTGGVVAAGLALGTLGFLLRRGPMRSAGTTWLLCAGVTFTMLVIAQQAILPKYARKFSLRAQVQPHAMRQSNDVAVACYPHRWDSVSFYLRRQDVRVYAENERPQLLADLRRQAGMLVFVKSERYLKDLVDALPGSWKFVPHGRGGLVTAGWICRRTEVPSQVFACLPASARPIR